ncbi:MAG: cation:proton antiporter [Mangrovicoccus sp.]|nr:cation:proton antiporter [Mangrovicoccus sp.]
MTPEFGLIALLGLIFAYALIGKRLENSVITAPMIFLVGGYLCAKSGLIHYEEADEMLNIIAEVALVVLLFADAAMINPRGLLREAAKPARMLLVGLPIMIGLGWVVGMVFLPGWPVWEMALLAALLAPTDAALGQSVVTNPRVPETMRRSLIAESGLNDGFALPFVIFFACIAAGETPHEIPTSWSVFVGEQLGFGVLAGVLTGGIGGWLLLRAERHGLSSPYLGGLAVLALAGLAYLLAHEIHGNGFIAAFTGGLIFGEIMHNRRRFLFEFIETEGQLLSIVAFFSIGALLLPGTLAALTPAIILLVLSSIFVLRPVAIWVSLMGSKTSPTERLFYGWFGPRGLATALFALLVLGNFHGIEQREGLLAAAAFAVIASTFLHGATAAPISRRFPPAKASQTPAE